MRAFKGPLFIIRKLLGKPVATLPEFPDPGRVLNPVTENIVSHHAARTLGKDGNNACLALFGLFKIDIE